MSGIVGSKLNIRGSGLIGSLGTDGQHLLSAGAGKTNVFETASGGFFGQAVQTVKTDTASSTTSSFTDTGFNVAITPTATSSKIMVIVSVQFGQNYSTLFRLARDIGGAGYNAICIGDAASSRQRTTGGSDGSATGGDTGDVSSWNTTFIDSPSTTSAVTYRAEWFVESGGTGYFNRSQEDVNNTHCPRSASQITVLEIL